MYEALQATKFPERGPARMLQYFMSWQAKSSTPPPGYSYGPRYSPSLQNRARGIAYILNGKPRSLARDALLAIADMPRPPLARGTELIPETGPLVVCANHYERPALWMVWPALLVSHLVAERTGRDTRWIAIQEWESFTVCGVAVPPALIRHVFHRAFDTYAILPMAPPNAPASGRARSLHASLEAVKAGEIMGLMPEGDVGPTPELLPAREGVGSFLMHLWQNGATLLPVGLYEERERLVAHFGETLDLTPARNLLKTERDAWVRDRIMQDVKALLPEPLWGAYRSR